MLENSENAIIIPQKPNLHIQIACTYCNCSSKPRDIEHRSINQQIFTFEKLYPLICLIFFFFFKYLNDYLIIKIVEELSVDCLSDEASLLC